MQLAPLYPVVHRVLKPVFPHCLWTGSSQHPTIALTFDDGPHPRYTLQLLEVLDQYAVTASFFWLGDCVKRYPTIAKAIYDRGHWIGLHGYDHRSFPLLSPSALKQTLEQTQAEIAIACQLVPGSSPRCSPSQRVVHPANFRLTSRLGLSAGDVERCAGGLG
jgi:peptidoglycan/xylan/chitin deacetylase (PgdA/CDA1 family)